MKKKNSTTILLLILITLISFVIKIAYINNTEIITPIRADAAQYVLYGYNLYKHGTYSQAQAPKPTPDSFRSPGFPLLIALAFNLGGIENFYLYTLLMQTALTSLLVPIAYLLARMLLPFWSALFVSLLVAFSPHLISISSYILTESLLSFLFLTALTCFLYGIRHSNNYLILLGYIFFGLSYLTNEVTFFIPFVVSGVTLVYFFYTKQPAKKFFPIKIILAGLIIFSLFPLGWTIRNSLNVPSNTIKASNRALNTITHGTYPDFIYKDPTYKYFPYREDPDQPEYSSSFDNFFKIFTQRVAERPFRYFVWFTIEKPYYLWTWNILQGQGDIYIYPVKYSLFTKYPLANYFKSFLKYLHIFLHFSIYIGIITLFFDKNRNVNDHNIYVLFSVFLYLSFIYTVFVPWPRYAIPYRPIFYTLGVWSIYSISLLSHSFKKIKTADIQGG